MGISVLPSSTTGRVSTRPRRATGQGCRGWPTAWTRSAAPSRWSPARAKAPRSKGGSRRAPSPRSRMRYLALGRTSPAARRTETGGGTRWAGGNVRLEAGLGEDGERLHDRAFQDDEGKELLEG